ncbi:nuclear migration protein, ami1 [Trichoderma parareesei]|uniref:Nuclear migration protein, ami1 n=1 Tax=Trichoderma parareesei TaxID=858221 RepID=A0A2H2ZNA4_TRIPA|nr:nuclear migration protein, ami1 [Trichoderma parareesei]
MSAWTDDEYMNAQAAVSLPPREYVPYRTPSTKSRKSRRSARSITPPAKKKISPTRNGNASKRSSRDITTDEQISILDPRRFTPTLHANLVSEILSLRRDQEEKTKVIESLESALQESREGLDALQESVNATTKENRSLQRQLSLLEGGTSSALGDLSRERDEAVESVAETKKRLEAAQRRIRGQEEDSQRVHEQWAEEKESWENEKRKYERRIHVAESRLQMVLDEVAAYQANHANGAAQQGQGHSHESDAEESGRDNDSRSVRTMSLTSSIRYSMANGPGLSLNTYSLADELKFDDTDDQTDIDGRESVFSSPRQPSPRQHRRTYSRESIISKLHRRAQSIDSMKRPGSVARGSRILMNQSLLEALEGEDEETEGEDSARALTRTPTNKPSYADAGLQVCSTHAYSNAGVQCSPVVEHTYSDAGTQCAVPPAPATDLTPPPTPVPKPPYTDTGIQSIPTPGPSYSDAGIQYYSDFEPSFADAGTQHSVTFAPSYVDSGVQDSPAPKPAYADTGIQFSPPSSPVLDANEPESGALDAETPPLSPQQSEPVHLPPAVEMPATPQRMVSSASQTVGVPLTPPKTPSSLYSLPNGSPASVKAPKAGPKMVTSSTQTEAPVPAPVVPPVPLPPLDIPSISIQPPTSRPASPHSPKLPQYFKDFGCQVNIVVQDGMVDSCSQTEAIQIDKRLARLPAHLQPSSITSRPTSPHTSGIAAADKGDIPLPGSLPPRNPRRLESSRYSTELPSSPISIAMDDRDLHNFDDDLLLSSQRAPIIPPRRFSSLFSGFCTDSDEIDEFGDLDLSDSEYRTALTAPRPPSNLSRTGKRSSFGTVTTSPEQPSKRSGRTSARSVRSGDLYSVGEDERPSRITELSPAPALSPSSRNSDMRKVTMAQTGMVNYPTIVEPKNPPPFPIPARASSRKPSISASSIPSDGRSTPSTTSWHRHRRSGSRTNHSNNVRRVRSANTLQRHERHQRTGSRTPPLSPSTEAPESPGLPPLPRNAITTPRNREGSTYKKHRHQLSNNTVMTAKSEAASQASSQTPGVVDAIAQTMVGEWMYKYVRRRKSFSVGEGAHKDENSNDRHKRWVWVAPYERAILWSSKQPSSGSALLGKTGRKLAIQSVLDVKDDNPAPRGVTTPIFNRSILILTPQRALKFTAPTAERHYLWLTALSFLAHSYQAVPDVLPAPAQQHLSVKQQPLPNFEPPRPTKLTRGGIRDSIRLAKGRAVAQKPDLSTMPSIPDVPSVRMGDVARFRVAESVNGPGHSREDSVDAAVPPMIPRFSDKKGRAAPNHSRKRSNTGGRVPPPLSFRGFAGPTLGEGDYQYANSTTGASIDTSGSSDIYQSQGSTAASWGVAQTPLSTVSSQQGNFFDAIGTVRMEAFISPHAYQEYNEYQGGEDYRSLARKKSKEFRRRSSRHRRRAQLSRSTRASDEFFSGSKTAGEEDFFRDDPFKGF